MAQNLRIKTARTEKDMTQKALAEAVGVSRQTMNAIEQGEYNPTIRLCRAICRVLGKSLDDLFGEDRTGWPEEWPEQKLYKEGTMMYCANCQIAFGDAERCPVCGSRKLREAEPDDPCFLTEEAPIPGGMLQEVLEDHGITAMGKSTIGAGMAMRAGAMFERTRVFVRYDQLEEAGEIAKQLLHSDPVADGGMTDPE